ncbi:MAG: hypothetical protein ACYC44_00075 [Patescibacteria group bacterium]
MINLFLPFIALATKGFVDERFWLLGFYESPVISLNEATLTPSFLSE